jgi:hypothetical protein
MSTATQLRLIGIICLTLGLVYQAGGWRKFWIGLHNDVSDPAPLDPERPMWANSAFLIGLVLVLLSFVLQFSWVFYL